MLVLKNKDKKTAPSYLLSALLTVLDQNIINFDKCNSILLYPNNIGEKGGPCSTLILASGMWTLME